MQTRDALKLIICFEMNLNRLVQEDAHFFFAYSLWPIQRHRNNKRNQVVRIWKNGLINDGLMIYNVSDERICDDLNTN